MKAIFITSLLFILMLSGCAKNNDNPVTRINTGLNTVLTISIYDCEDESIFTEVFTEINRIEKLLSVDYDGSDLDRLFDNGGDVVRVSPETFFLLEESHKYSEMSNGAFDVTIGPLVSCWSINENTGRVPSKEEIDKALELINYKNIELLNGKYARLKNKGMKVNLGAIAKGYIADKAKELLLSRNVKSAIINLGGNIILIGEKPDNQPFNIGIQEPNGQNGKYLGFVQIRDKSLVSSGTYERFFEKDGIRYHHILDTSTGYPADNELLQSTIISDKSIDGDGLSTTTFLLGLSRGMELVEQLPGVEGIFVTKDKEVYISSGLDAFTLTNNEYTIKQLK